MVMGDRIICDLGWPTPSHPSQLNILSSLPPSPTLASPHHIHKFPRAQPSPQLYYTLYLHYVFAFLVTVGVRMRHAGWGVLGWGSGGWKRDGEVRAAGLGGIARRDCERGIRVDGEWKVERGGEPGCCGMQFGCGRWDQ